MHLSELERDEQELLQAARSVMHRAYNLYSGFFVGAAVRTGSGRIYAGANLENASLGLTICAEPAAITRAYGEGDPDIRDIAVVGGPALDSNGEMVSPCGRCRQLIYEAAQVSETDIVVLCANADLSKVTKARISDLLPSAFELGGRDKIKAFLRRSRS